MLGCGIQCLHHCSSSARRFGSEAPLSQMPTRVGDQRRARRVLCVRRVRVQVPRREARRHPRSRRAGARDEAAPHEACLRLENRQVVRQGLQVGLGMPSTARRSLRGLRTRRCSTLQVVRSSSSEENHCASRTLCHSAVPLHARSAYARLAYGMRGVHACEVAYPTGCIGLSVDRIRYPDDSVSRERQPNNLTPSAVKGRSSERLDDCSERRVLIGHVAQRESSRVSQVRFLGVAQVNVRCSRS